MHTQNRWPAAADCTSDQRILWTFKKFLRILEAACCLHTRRAFQFSVWNLRNRMIDEVFVPLPVARLDGWGAFDRATIGCTDRLNRSPVSPVRVGMLQY